MKKKFARSPSLQDALSTAPAYAIQVLRADPRFQRMLDSLGAKSYEMILNSSKEVDRYAASVWKPWLAKARQRGELKSKLDDNRVLEGMLRNDEARAWHQWLAHTATGGPETIRTLYDVEGGSSVSESEIPWLTGFRGSRPVRLGNAASGQFQLDIFGEVVAALAIAKQAAPTTASEFFEERRQASRVSFESMERT